jgi:hypothetical protein
MRPACRYCKSPARGNPCWYFLDRPEHAAGGGDPPCIVHEDDDEAPPLPRFGLRWSRWLFIFILAAVVAAIYYRSVL